MKAIRIHHHGGPEALVYEDAPTPQPGAGEVLIRVMAIGVNPADHKHREGMFKDFITYAFPHILGYDVAGTIEALGSGVDGPAIGTRVLAMLDPMAAGGYAEFVTTLAENCAAIPANMDFATAAAFPCPGLTGLQLVEEHLRPAKDDAILITGATGMVGRFAVLAAKQAGARIIAAVRPAYMQEARDMGATEVIALDGREWEGAPFDAVIDTVGGPATSALAAATKPGGRILTVATDPLDMARLPVSPEFIPVRPDGRRLASLAETVASGAMPLAIAARYPLAEARQANEAIEKGGLRGKVVLMVD